MDLEEQKTALLSQPLRETELNAHSLRKGVTKSDIVGEAKKQLGLAGPLVCVNVLAYCLQMISVMFVGHLGELPLAGASMATSFASVTGFSLLVRSKWFLILGNGFFLFFILFYFYNFIRMILIWF